MLSDQMRLKGWNPSIKKHHSTIFQKRKLFACGKFYEKWCNGFRDGSIQWDVVLGRYHNPVASYLWHSRAPRSQRSSGSVRPRTPRSRYSPWSSRPSSLRHQNKQRHSQIRHKKKEIIKSWKCSTCNSISWHSSLLLNERSDKRWMAPQTQGCIRLVWSSCYHSLGNGQALTYTQYH